RTAVCGHGQGTRGLDRRDARRGRPRGNRYAGHPPRHAQGADAQRRTNPMTWLEPVTLSGSSVRLELLDRRHESDLIDAVRDGELWRLWYTTVPAPEKMSAEIDRRLRLNTAGSMLPFAVIDLATGKAVGMTTYMNADAINKRVEIGATWYRRSVQRT